MVQFEHIRSEARQIERHRVFASRNAHEIHAQLGRSLAAHRMEVDSDAALDVELHSVSLGRMRVMRLRYGADVAITPSALPSHLLLQVVLSGQSRLEQEGDVWTVDAGSALVIEDLDRCRLSWSADCEQLIIPISRVAVSQASERLAGQAPRRFGIHRSFSLADEGQSLADLLCYTMRLAARDEAAASHLSDPLEAMLAHELLVSHSSVARASRTAIAVPGYVFRAERYIAAHLEHEFSMAELARSAGTSQRTLSEGFRRFRDNSPVCAVRDMRLDKVREILVEGAVQSITDVALQFRFNHVGRFSSYYKARFGETPSKTLMRHAQGTRAGHAAR
jgi:AraC-like DNA-binding protein